MDRFRLDQRKYERHPDFKEMMVEEIRRENKQRHNEQANLPDPDSFYGRSDQYIMLDTFRKNPLSDVANGEFIFDLMIQGSTGDYVVGVKERLNNIVEMQIGSFNVPLLPLNYYPILSSNPASTISGSELLRNTADLLGSSLQVQGNQRFTICVKEASLQSYSDKNGKRHHFDVLLTNSSINNYLQSYDDATTDNLANPANAATTVYTATPDLDWNTYYFTDPIQDFSTITLQMKNPDINLRFLPDVYYNVNAVFSISAGVGNADPGAAFNAGTEGQYYLIIDTGVAHNIPVNSKIIITGLNTPNNGINNYINNVNGLITTTSYTTTGGVSVATTNSLWVNPIINVPATAGLTDTIFKVNVYVPSRRMRIPMRMRRVIDRTTNFKDV